jgi:parallel beta-helix repeat protein
MTALSLDGAARLTRKLQDSDPGLGADMVANADRSFASIDAMTAAPKPALAAGRTLIASLLAFYAGGAHGGGQFRWQANSNQTPVDGMIVNPTGNVGAGRWIRVLNGRDVDAGWVGAKGDGITDDTAKLNIAVSYVNALGGGNVTFPAGTYMVNASGNATGIQMKSGVYLRLAGAKLKALGANSPNYRLVAMQEVSNCGVIGGEIEGDRSANAGVGEQGHGIYAILDCANIKIEGVKVSNCFGDGIYLGRQCSIISVANCTLTNNRRNNISIVSASNVVIQGCDISHANGVAPQNGIDVEPNVGDAVSNGVIIANCNIYGNAMDGVAFPAPPPTPLIDTAIVTGCNIHSNGRHGVLGSYVRKLEVANCIIRDNGGDGIADSAALATLLNLHGNVISNNAGSGISGFASNTSIANNQISSCGAWGVYFKYGQNVKITRNIISECAQDGIYYERAYNCQISGNSVKNTQKHGIFITGTNTSSVTRSRKVAITGNSVMSAGLLADSTYCGIYLDANANTSSVTGNTVAALATGNQPQYAIHAVDASVIVTNNQTEGGANSDTAQGSQAH